MSLAPGVRLGAYEILAAIGAGGMGEVYRARDTRLKRDVAIKILPEAFAHDAERLARFQREAELLATLNHPNIGAVYGLEQSEGANAIVLELIDGETLADRLQRSAIPVEETLQIARQIAEALEAAHGKGVIHRDLKPANIKLTSEGTVKVLDFGLAKAADRSDVGRNFSSAGAGSLRQDPADLSQSPTITSPAMATHAGIILGTAAYMSPEQAKGKPVDKRADIWAFGCVLYEMLTGKRPFDGEDVTDVLAAVVRGEPDWTALPDDVPEHIRLLMRRCLEKDRGKRVSDIGVARFLIVEPIAAAAMRVAPASAASAPAPRPLWRRALPALASAIVASALGGAAVWELRPSPPQTVTRFTYRLGEGQQFTTGSRHLVAISPDGTQMAYVANLRLYLKSSWEVEATPIPGTGGGAGDVVTTPVFSADGGSIAFFSGSGGGGTLKKIATSGGAPVTLCQASNPFGMSWDGDSILFGQAGKGILRVSANGGTPEVLAGIKDNEVAHGPQMLPGGRSLLYTLASGTDWDNAQIVVQTPGSSERQTVIKGGADARYLPTGHIVYALAGVLFTVPFDAQRLEVVGGPVPIVEGVRRGNVTAAAQFAVSRTGSLMYIPGPTTTASFQLDLALLDRKGAVERLKLPPRAYEFPRVSPDGRQLAVGIDDGKEANVWIYDLSGTSAIRRLTFGGENRYPIWTSDSARVAFQSDREGDSAIFWQRADGTGATERITKPDKGQAHIPNAWSPKGDSFLFSVGSGSNQSLWTFSLQDKKAAPFGAVRNSSLSPNAAFSPNGRWIAYASNETDRQAVFVQPFPATGAKYQIAVGNNPFWAPDGKELFFSPEGPQFVFMVVSVKTEPTFTFGNPTSVPRPRAVLRGHFPNPRNYDIAPEGNRFVIVVDASDTATDAGSAPRIQVVLNWFEELNARVPSGQ